MSACSLRYDFTQCEVDDDCSLLENVNPSDPAQNEFYQCQANECVVEANRQCETDQHCGGDDECIQGQCEPTNVDPDADGGMDTEDTQDTEEDTEEVIENTCEDTQDCLDDENFGEGYACSSDNECVETGCSDDTFCTDTFGTDFACGADDECTTTTCDSTTYCIDSFGDSYYCRTGGTCVDTSHPVCNDVFYPSGANTEDVVLLGTIIPTEIQGFQEVGPTFENATRMAVLEYGNNAFDLPGGQAVGHLQCEGGTQSNVVEAANHLRDIGVPVIVGPLTSENYITMVQDITGDPNDNPVVTMAPGATSPGIEALNASGTYSYQVISNDRFQSTAITDRIKNLKERSCTEVTENECTSETECQETFGDDWTYDSGNATEPCSDPNPKIVAFYKNDKYGNDLQSLTATRIGDRYTEADISFYQYADPADLDFDPDDIASEFGNVISQAIGDVPDADIVLFLSTGEGVQLASSYIFALSGAGADPTTRQYVFSHGAASDTPAIMEEFASPEDYLPRIESVSPQVLNTTGGLFDKWQSRYNITFGTPTSTTAGGLAYDAAFMSVMAMAHASVDGEVTAERVKDAFTEGVLQDASSTQIVFEEPSTFPVDAKREIGRGNNVDLVGVSGDLNFVFENGDNLGIVRQNYLGLDIIANDTPGGTVYSLDPSRLYLLTPGEVFGTWTDI